jgi:rubrerythrin
MIKQEITEKDIESLKEKMRDMKIEQDRQKMQEMQIVIDKIRKLNICKNCGVVYRAVECPVCKLSDLTTGLNILR